jgi:hypothetical protein
MFVLSDPAGGEGGERGPIWKEDGKRESDMDY